MTAASSGGMCYPAVCWSEAEAYPPLEDSACRRCRVRCGAAGRGLSYKCFHITLIEQKSKMPLGDPVLLGDPRCLFLFVYDQLGTIMGETGKGGNGR
jgi:hypothetical protein